MIFFCQNIVDTFILICYNLNAFTKCMEEYPSPVEGIGLENRQVEKSAQGFESLFLRQFLRYRGMVAVW